MDPSLEAKAVSIMFLNTAKIALVSPKCLRAIAHIFLFLFFSHSAPIRISNGIALTSFYPYIFPKSLSVLSMLGITATMAFKCIPKCDERCFTYCFILRRLIFSVRAAGKYFDCEVKETIRKEIKIIVG